MGFNLNISLIQADLFWEDKDKNLQQFDDLLADIDEPCDVVALPEMFNTGFSLNPAKLAEGMDGPSIGWMREKASSMRCVVMGTLAIAEDGKYYNRLIWMQPDGEIKYYDKRHLFSPGGEKSMFTPGVKAPIFEVLGWKVMPLVCYDLRFPVWSKNTFDGQSYAYDLLLYVANWPAPRSQVFRKLLPARAIENLSYVAAVNRTGIDGNGLNHQGDSCVVDFKGNVLADLGLDRQSVETVHLDYNALAAFRKEFPVGADWDSFAIQA